MRELRGHATTGSRAPREDWLRLVSDVERYPEWYPEGVREVVVLERDGDVPSRVRTKLHAAVGPVSRDFELEMDVLVAPPDRVTLTRVTTEASQQTFEVAWIFGEGEGTEVEVRLHANLRVPRFMPVDGLGDVMARGFVDAAHRELDGTPPPHG